MPKKLLLIEDEPDIVKVVVKRLESAGYAVITAGDGLAGLEMIRTEKPDLVITDLLLPKLDGWRVCHMIKTAQNFRHIPVIVLSGSVLDESPPTGVQEADLFMLKPFKPEQLLSAVRGLLQDAPPAGASPA
jgi:DNA-binding response OmpR family regulator